MNELELAIIPSVCFVPTKPAEYRRALRLLIDSNPHLEMDLICERLDWSPDYMLWTAFAPDLEFL